MNDFINLLWQCFYDVTEGVDVSFDDMESADEGLEVEFNCIFEDR